MKKQKKIRVRKPKLSEAEKILANYRVLCLEKREEREGYRLSLKDGHLRVGKIHKMKVAIKFLSEVENVIRVQHLLECFPYGQAFFHLKEMIEDKIIELEKIEKGA